MAYRSLDLTVLPELLEEGDAFAKRVYDALVSDGAILTVDEFVSLCEETGEAILAADFTDFARDLAHEQRILEYVEEWPLYCIDWEWAAAVLQNDYACCEIDGVEYFFHIL